MVTSTPPTSMTSCAASGASKIDAPRHFGVRLLAGTRPCRGTGEVSSAGPRGSTPWTTAAVARQRTTWGGSARDDAWATASGSPTSRASR
ncbi:hypothetical protein FHN55_04980 [Streptomyces sp. NP160]|uniref:hypothetical protein n=1 Tax=Streptomyces sp. NP160 TaxID=2586637 RepID=UPI00111A6FD9|nr:hypothetical protein [Streptomyces sp. NP160]TNM69140.1 hypothetical protein FHN55_04980 [Streptomyces sp. NP160]